MGRSTGDTLTVRRSSNVVWRIELQVIPNNDGRDGVVAGEGGVTVYGKELRSWQPPRSPENFTDAEGNIPTYTSPPLLLISLDTFDDPVR